VFFSKKYNKCTSFNLNVFLIIHGTQKDNENLAFLLSLELAPPCPCKEKEDNKKARGVAIMTVLAVVQIPTTTKTFFLIFFP
jgi:hypothetical protein